MKSHNCRRPDGGARCWLHARTSHVLQGQIEVRVPFVQLLSSITASGKTIVLADAVAAIAKELPVAPIVLWLSKASVVVDQTYANLDAGGNLRGLMTDFSVSLLSEYDSVEAATSSHPMLCFATVGTFNQKDKEKGNRRIFKTGLDDTKQATWDALKVRPNAANLRRPLLVVYDEAQNLSDQQTKLLLELEPDALLLATATQRLPQRINDEAIELLKRLGGRTDADLVTFIDAKEVADSQLIKTTIELVGRQAPMEEVLGEMIGEIKQTAADGADFGLRGAPKAVYICKTNVIEGSDERDNHKRPFVQRMAPPILIWRCLVEKLGVDPSEIAVYADLKVDKNFPVPDDFVLFNGADSDYTDFVSGGFRHIIFNQSLQEGWDDPLVYFAYIDKSMGSRIQAEQIIGRLLRQPGRHHYAADRLNTAQIYVRVESTGVFDEVVSAVQHKIATEGVAIRVLRTPAGSKLREEFPAKDPKTVPVAAIVTDAAIEPIEKLVQTMNDYRQDTGVNVTGVGAGARVQKVVGEPGNQSFVWEQIGHSAKVLARWLFSREVRRVYPGALGVALTSGADGAQSKFDAWVGLGSNAAVHIAQVAKQVADTYVGHVHLKLRKSNPYTVGPLLQQADKIVPYTNSLHQGYEGLNPDETKFAEALDRTGLVWARNPSRTGYGIPMIEPGRTENFYPDFLVWAEGDSEVFAIDTKASFLHSDALRKMVKVRPASESSPRLFVRFVSPGLVDEQGAKKDATGFTVWTFKPNGSISFTHDQSVDDAVARCLKPDVNT